MHIADRISNAERDDAPHMLRSPSSPREERGPLQYFGRIVCATSTTNRPASATACVSPTGAWQRLYTALHKATDRQAWCCIREDGHVVNRPLIVTMGSLLNTHEQQYPDTTDTHTSLYSLWLVGFDTHIPHFPVCV